MKTVCIDGREAELPFSEKEFDFIYHAGLLEHYSGDERIGMLRNWKKYCKEMISMVPNASSVGYRIGKAIMEKEGQWAYGQENIIYSQILEFLEAGYKIKDEYTIGLKNSLNFLKNDHYYKQAVQKLWKENLLEDDCHQGYLLVTRGSS